MLVALDELNIRARRSVDYWHEIHLESAIIACEGPWLFEPALTFLFSRNVELDLGNFVSFAIIEKHVLACRTRIAEAVADIPTEIVTIYHAGGRAPVPSIVICPYAATPVEQTKGLSVLELIDIPTNLRITACMHAVDFLIEIEMRILLERRADYHGFLRNICKLYIYIYRLTVLEIIHVCHKMSLLVGHIEANLIASPTTLCNSFGGSVRQIRSAKRQSLHRTLGNLPRCRQLARNLCSRERSVKHQKRD